MRERTLRPNWCLHLRQVPTSNLSKRTVDTRLGEIGLPHDFRDRSADFSELPNLSHAVRHEERLTTKPYASLLRLSYAILLPLATNVGLKLGDQGQDAPLEAGWRRSGLGIGAATLANLVAGQAWRVTFEVILSGFGVIV
jgi:hypothetical protein